MAPRRKSMKKRAMKKRTKRSAVKATNTRNKSVTIKYGLVSEGLVSSPVTRAQVNLIGGGTMTPSILQLQSGSFEAAAPSMFQTAGIGTGYDFGASMIFSAADAQRLTPMFTTWDEYRFRKVQVKIECMFNNSLPGGGANPTVWYAVDKDDATIPTTQATVTGRAGVRQFQFSQGKTLTINLKPSLRQVLYDGDGGAPAFALTPPKWIDCSNAQSVPHYGLKFWFTDVELPGTSDAPTLFRITYNYWIDFRGLTNTY